MNRGKKIAVGCLIGCGSMVLLVFISLALLGIMVQRSTQKLQTAQAPDLGHIPIFRPEFETQLGMARGGTGFLAQSPDDDETLILTAYHLLGTSGGLEEDIPPQDVGDKVYGVTLYPITPFQEVTSDRVAPIADASVMTDRDFVAFRVDDALKPHALPIRDTSLGLGEVVWLYAEVAGEPERLLHKARIWPIFGTLLLYTYADEVDLQATSGAPVVDAEGRLVAINLGGSDGVGIGAPAKYVRQHLSTALRQ